MPVILDKDGRFPEAEILPVITDLALNFVGSSLHEIFQICERSRWRAGRGTDALPGELEISHAASILEIIELPPNHGGTVFDVMRTLGPGHRAGFLEHIIDVVDGNEVVVAEGEITTRPYEASELNRRKSRNICIYVGIWHPELRGEIVADVRRSGQ